VLKSPGEEPLNRLFTIRFPTLAEHDAFFADPDYQAVRTRYLNPSVSYVLRIGRYEVLS
jgi:hypothetical protein